MCIDKKEKGNMFFFCKFKFEVFGLTWNKQLKPHILFKTKRTTILTNYNTCFALLEIVHF